MQLMYRMTQLSAQESDKQPIRVAQTRYHITLTQQHAATCDSVNARHLILSCAHHVSTGQWQHWHALTDETLCCTVTDTQAR
jgi:hypothetical protein